MVPPARDKYNPHIAWEIKTLCLSYKESCAALKMKMPFFCEPASASANDAFGNEG